MVTIHQNSADVCARGVACPTLKLDKGSKMRFKKNSRTSLCALPVTRTKINYRSIRK